MVLIYLGCSDDMLALIDDIINFIEMVGPMEVRHRRNARPKTTDRVIIDS